MMRRASPKLVESADGVVEVASACQRVGRFALDTEADSMHSYFHKVCLVQVTAGEYTFIVDPLALDASDLEPLWAVVGDPDVTTVMHGADYDIRVLDRDYDARVRGLEDTQIMARLLGEQLTGLAALLEREFDLRLDKRFQRADWGVRPLRRPLIEYAAGDTMRLVDLADRLARRLREKGRWSWLMEECGRLERVRHVPSAPDPLAFERIKGARRLIGKARDRLFSLAGWREDQARRLDLPPFKVLGNRQLLSLAESPPADLGSLASVDGLGPRFARRWGRQVLRILATPKSAPPAARAERDAPQEASVRRRLKALQGVRAEVAQELGIEGGLLCPRAVLVAVASESPPPESRSELAACGLDGWRLEALADPVLAALGTPS